MSSNRLEAFSDGVLAIVITIMVLEMKVPHGSAMADLLPSLPVFLSYVLSFIYVGIYWNNHHHLFQAVDRVNGAALWANLHLLFWLSLIPFVTGWMGGNHVAQLPVALYGVVLLGAAVAFRILLWVLVAHLGRESALARAMGRDRKGKLSTLLYLAAIPLAALSVWPAVALYVVVAMLWLIPEPRIETALAHAAREDGMKSFVSKPAARPGPTRTDIYFGLQATRCRGVEPNPFSSPEQPVNNVQKPDIAGVPASDAVQVMKAILDNPMDIDNVRRWTVPDVTYVSLNYENATRKSVMPWCGTGPEAIVDTFKGVSRYWSVEAFEPRAVFGDREHAAMFGSFTYRSTTPGKQVTWPFAVYARVVNGKCVYLQFMEDTLATTDSFHKGGEWLIQSDPDGSEVTI